MLPISKEKREQMEKDRQRKKQDFFVVIGIVGFSLLVVLLLSFIGGTLISGIDMFILAPFNLVWDEFYSATIEMKVFMIGSTMVIIGSLGWIKYNSENKSENEPKKKEVVITRSKN